MAAGASSARAMRCDVTKLDDWNALAASIEGPVDLVINNAGVSSAGLVGELPMEDWRWTLEVNLFGVINGCHVFAPILRKQGHGHVLNVASAAGLFSPPFIRRVQRREGGRHRALRDARRRVLGQQAQGDRDLPDVLQDEHRQQRSNRRREGPRAGEGPRRRRQVGRGRSRAPPSRRSTAESSTRCRWPTGAGSGA